MSELELYRFIKDNDIEWSRQGNDGTPDVLIFPYTFQVHDFYKLLKGSIDEGIRCTLMDGYFAFWMKDICEAHDIDIDKVFDPQVN